MNIFVVASNNYPSKKEPHKGTFVYNLVQEFVKLGNCVTVFAPKKMFVTPNTAKVDYGSEGAFVFRPIFLSLSNKNLFLFNTFFITRKILVRLLKRTLKFNNIRPDVVYAHFLSNALIASEAFYDMNIPIIVAVGEYTDIDVTKSYYSENDFYRFSRRISGFIAVSKQIKDKLFNMNIATKQNCLIAQNGVDLAKFQLTSNKYHLRQILGLPLEKKIILFVGRFCHDKGPKRVVRALEILGKQEFTAVFLGKGSYLEQNPFIYYIGNVSNKQVAEYMAAADLFVLPTLNEGSCNAIVEAMASGLPIVSSDIPELWEQCTTKFSTLVDPMNEHLLARAIDSILSNEKKLLSMSQAARSHASRFCLKNRASIILDFLEQKI